MNQNLQHLQTFDDRHVVTCTCGWRTGELVSHRAAVHAARMHRTMAKSRAFIQLFTEPEIAMPSIAPATLTYDGEYVVRAIKEWITEHTFSHEHVMRELSLDEARDNGYRAGWRDALSTLRRALEADVELAARPEPAP